MLFLMLIETKFVSLKICLSIIIYIYIYSILCKKSKPTKVNKFILFVLSNSDLFPKELLIAIEIYKK